MDLVRDPWRFHAANDPGAFEELSDEDGDMSAGRPVPRRGAAAPELRVVVPAAAEAAEGEAPIDDAADANRVERTPADDARLATIVNGHFDFIWRSLRRLGVPGAEVDDCAQQVFWVAARKLAMIQPGSERAFLFSTALRVASDARRSRMRRREVPFAMSPSGEASGEEAIAHQSDPAPRPDEIADRKRARALLDEVLAAMEIDLRAVFVLFELEEMPTQDIANMLSIPTGTVASRLRRAREEFQRLALRVQRGSFKPATSTEPSDVRRRSQ